MFNQYICPIWKVKAELVSGQGDYVDVMSSQIPYKYRLTGSAGPMVNALGNRERARLTTWIVDQHALGERLPTVTTDIVDQACAQPAMTILHRCDRLMSAIVECCPHVGQEFILAGLQTPEILNHKAFARAWSGSESDNELTGLLRLLADNGYAKASSTGYMLDLKGLIRLEELRNIHTASQQAFVAMWFDASMTVVYKDGIEAGIINVGYAPMRIDAKEHANKIDDEIIAEIRRSKFVVADFTSEKDKPRGGVYYEAGFAMGLGLPVIWTCRSDMIGNVHFDTRQFNHITWENPDDLRTKLERRIGAVIGDGPLPRPVVASA